MLNTRRFRQKAVPLRFAGGPPRQDLAGAGRVVNGPRQTRLRQPGLDFRGTEQGRSSIQASDGVARLDSKSSTRDSLAP